MLVIQGLNVSYGDVQVLWDVSMEVREGTVVVLVGANGAGKTTLLKTVAGLVPARSGQILFAGEPLHALNPMEIVQRGVVLVPEGRSLFTQLTVWENLILGAYTPRARKRLGESLERVFDLFPILKTRKNQKAGSLSGGEQQMLAIGRAIMARPRLLMLDEPSLGLSPLLVKQVFERIGGLHQQEMTILLVEQNVYQALRIAQRAYVMRNGTIVMSGSGQELLASDEVRRAYIGEVLPERR